jgi:hypothetical protein
MKDKLQSKGGKKVKNKKANAGGAKIFFHLPAVF